MLAEWCFYIFIFPWLLLMAVVPSLIFLYLFAGIGAQLVNYFPIKKNNNR